MHRKEEILGKANNSQRVIISIGYTFRRSGFCEFKIDVSQLFSFIGFRKLNWTKIRVLRMHRKRTVADFFCLLANVVNMYMCMLREMEN